MTVPIRARSSVPDLTLILGGDIGDYVRSSDRGIGHWNGKHNEGWVASMLCPKRRYHGFPGKKHLRQNESITIDPVGVFGVESHEFVEKDVGNRCHTHGRAGMPGVGCEGGINLHTRSNQ